MAVARCVTCVAPGRKAGAYVMACSPQGYPASGVICGVSGCEEPAVLWLSAWEAAEYRSGRRIFGLSGKLPKVQLKEQSENDRLIRPHSDHGAADGSLGLTSGPGTPTCAARCSGDGLVLA